MSKRRANREGSIFKRQDGRWVAAITLPDGKRWLKYSPTQTLARKKLRAMLEQLDEGFNPAGGKDTLANFLRYWLKIVTPSLRPKTIVQYRHICDRYIIPALGSVRLGDLRTDLVQELYTTELSRGTGVRTVQFIHAVLHRALEQACRWGFVKRNVVSQAEKPRQPRTEMQVLSAEQARRFLAAAESHRLYALFHLAVTTGLRRGELLGLRWDDLDWDTGRLQIQRQLQRISGKGLVFAEPKTRSGRRSITLARIDLAILQGHRKRQLEERLFAGAEWHEHDLFFPSLTGTPHDPDNLSREFHRILTESGVQRIRFHDLRHTAATLMLSQGTHPKIVQERLGHASINLTLDTYSHVLPNMQDQAADAIDRLFGATSKSG